jgi:hypothetical protein
MSLDHVEQGKSTQLFLVGHFHFIAQELEQRGRELKRGQSNTNIDPALECTGRNVETLASVLMTVSSEPNNLGALSTAQRIHAIRGALEKTSTSL